MKILCPEHNGMIEVSTSDIADAVKSLTKSLVFNCPICQDKVLITNIRLEQEVTLSNVVQIRGRKKHKGANGG